MPFGAADETGEAGNVSTGRADMTAAARLPAWPRWARWALAAAIALAVLLRLVALDSDPYARLSWSSGLLTDEGFYIHNARNVALFGSPVKDGFNNMLIMPTLHFVQVAVLRVWGVGAVPARMISVVCSLLAVAALYFAVNRAFGRRAALIAALILALDHTNLLYNRMALMDTPGELLLVCALYAWVRGVEGSFNLRWMAACGALLAVAAITRSLAGLAVPAVFIAVWLGRRRQLATGGSGAAAAAPEQSFDVADRTGSPETADGLAGQDQTALGESSRSPAATMRPGWTELPAHASRPRPGTGPTAGAAALALSVGIGIVLAVYYQAWYSRFGWRIEAMSSYYLRHQLLPSSPGRLALNAFNAWLGDERGAAPFLMRHTPVQVLLGGGWMYWRLRRARYRDAEPQSETCERHSSPTEWLVVAWLCCAALFLSVASYAPSRYYLIFYPPLAIVAALGLANIGQVIRALLASRRALFAAGAYCAYHGALLVWHHANLPSILAVANATVIGGAGALLLRAAIGARRERVAAVLRRAPAVAVLLWAAINAGYYADWLAGLRYGERDASRLLAAAASPGATVFGDVAPGLCMYNRLAVVPVIPGLCNDNAPVERYRGARFVAVLDDPYRERWWDRNYPEIVTPANRLARFPSIARFPVVIYRVPDSFVGQNVMRIY
ncbi:MAG TPA: glycosyltransferase family 39 protein [Chthonomonadaceae bacterium]|nr:glycosyltransferase family 39 protein [Chthonomonadaceae bacterium]